MNTTQALLEQIRATPELPVIFEYGEARVAPGYHVTEVKSATFETMDCGGQGNLWHETIVQLMSYPNEVERGYMTADKFLKIYDRATASLPIRANAEIRFEYGIEGTPAISYHVARVERQIDGLVVFLQAPNVSCKASDRQALPMLEMAGSPTNTCCT